MAGMDALTPLEQLLNERQTDKGTLSLITPAADPFLAARKIVDEALTNLGPFSQPEAITAHAITNFVARIEDQAEGMLASFLMGFPASSETIARTVVEMSVNLMYITRGDVPKRLFSFFRVYMREHKKHLEDWKAFISKQVPSKTVAEVLEMIREAQEVADGTNKFLIDVANQCGVIDGPNSFEWPNKIFERFKSADKIDSYWTVYHRLSAATHGNAEETIRYVIGEFCRTAYSDEEILVKLGIETISFSAMMLCVAVRFYIESAACVCIFYRRFEAATKLRPLYEAVEKAIEQIAPAAGSASPPSQRGQ
jgi:hypothetical protein